MTKLFDDPATFTDDMLEGFLDAHARYAVAAPGGVVRATGTRAGKVAVVVGGGSGHYPAFCGVVGAGFADGAVVGNIFTSPSTDDAYGVARAADGGGGVLFVTGNYAGDVMNFDLARDRLVAEGVDTRTLYVTDDVASAPVDEARRRRGIAGDFVVFKVAGAAAEEGLDLDTVEALARHANDRTRTMGVGLDGCTMPGADDALFHVPDGLMGVGLGIHGEPGISEDALPTAAVLAELLLDRVLAEEPAASTRRVGAILNGLGSTKYEELFVVWRTVARLLRERGYTVVDPEVGELVTSLDMAGVSLTLVYLDDDLERLWRAPADTPAFRKGALATLAGADRADRVAGLATVAHPTRSLVTTPTDLPTVATTDASRVAGLLVADALAAMEHALRGAEDELGRIDAVAGDGDHGRGMVKGVAAAAAAARSAADSGSGAASVLTAAGRQWASRAGGTSGVLWGAFLSAAGPPLPDDAESLGGADVVAAVRAGSDALMTLGGAEPGDKTMVDALLPFLLVLDAEVAAGSPLAQAWSRAADAATTAAQATSDLRPRIGRARPLADRSVGTPDAGATSLALVAHAVAGVLAGDGAPGAAS
ncbi:dihydroxyacetone kinase family protein [Oryzobacter terrae]|uniref:dihydroxyacetone kinase family protein n=1 Tax=Oryzobacter terrae TaxID=1620385 RepID=UPI00366F0ACC